jgi:hypothetical protein
MASLRPKGSVGRSTYGYLSITGGLPTFAHPLKVGPTKTFQVFEFLFCIKDALTNWGRRIFKTRSGRREARIFMTTRLLRVRLLPQKIHKFRRMDFFLQETS